MGGVCSSSAAGAASADDGYRSLAARVATSTKTGQLDASALGVARLDELRDGLHARTRAINVSRNRLTDLSGLVGYPLLADKLQKLNVSLNPQLAALPPLAAYAALVTLDAHGCDVRGGSDSVPSLPPRLRELDLSGNARLARPPRCVWALADLRVLRLAATGLAALPAALAALRALTELVVDDNPLESLALVDGDDGGDSGASASSESVVDADGGNSGGAGGGWAALPRLVTLSARRCRLRAEPTCLPRGLLGDSGVTALHLGGNPGLTQRGLLGLPGMEEYVRRRKAALDRGMTGDGGGRLSLAAHLCGVEA